MSLLALAAAEGHNLAPMVMDPIWFAVIAAGIFTLLGFVVWSFRDIANRHGHEVGSVSHADSSHGTDHH